MPSISIQGSLQIGQPVTINYSGFGGEPVGPVTITDASNTTVSLSGTTSDFSSGSGTFVTGAYPALPANGQSVTPFNLPGSVTVTLVDPGE